MPCVQEKARREREVYVRAHRRDVNPFEGVEDPLEIIKLMHTSREHDPLIRYAPWPGKVEDLYATLNSTQIAALTKHASELLEGDPGQSEAIARCLTAFTSADIDSLLARFVAAERFYPGFIFLRAKADIRDSLIGRLDRLPNTQHCSLARGHLLSALAWIGDGCVADLFDSWRRQPPSWKDTLLLPPEDYARVAGWELSGNAQRHDLYYRNCYALTPKGLERSTCLTAGLSERSDHCIHCGHALRNLIQLDRCAWLSNRLGGRRLSIPLCEFRFETIGKFGSESSWEQQDTTHCPVDISQADHSLLRELDMAATPRGPWHAADQFLPTTFSQIGGQPAWVQDPEYPRCSECRQTMIFVGQVALQEVAEHGEGMHYAFFCSVCATTATRFQQT